MIDQRYKNLAEEIGRKASKLDWTRSNFANSYQLSLGRGMVIISHNENRTTINPFVELPEYSLRFLNERGETLHTIETDGTPLDQNKKLLEGIYNTAYDTYMQSEETYKSMLDDLSKVL